MGEVGSFTRGAMSPKKLDDGWRCRGHGRSGRIGMYTTDLGGERAFWGVEVNQKEEEKSFLDGGGQKSFHQTQ